MDSRKRVATQLQSSNKDTRYKEPGHDSRGRYAPITYNTVPRYIAPKSTQKELGFVDLTLNGSLSTIGSIHHINIIPNNTSASGRIGKKVTLKYVQIRGISYPLTTHTGSSNAFIIVYDIRPGTTLPAITDILNSPSPYALNNDANNGRFKILHREDWVTCGSYSNPVENTLRNMAQFHKLNKKTEYGNAGTGAIGDVALGGLYFVFIGSEVGTNGSTCAMSLRLRFQDE